MSSSNKLPRSMKNLWTLLSGSVNLKSLQFVADELEQSQQQLIEGILFYKPNNSDEKEKNSSIPIGKITEIRNMSIFLDLDQDQCYQLFQSYLLYEYKGTPEMAKSLFNNEKQRKELFEQLWSYYYSERIFTLFCFKQILSNWKSNEHIYSKIFQDFIKHLNTENQLLTKLVDQLKLLIRFNFDSRSKYGPYFSEKFQNDLRENIQKEQSEILQLLLLYYKNFEPSIENVIQLLKLFSENVFLNKSMSSNLNEFIGLLKSLLIVECLDPNYLYKCHMDGIEHFILKSDNGTSINEINTLILSLNTSVTDNSPIFLCWMIISILDNSVSSDYVERLGNTALELKVFKYLHRCLQSTHLSTLNGSLVYNLVHEIIGNLLAVTFSTFDFDRLIQTEPSLSHLLIELFQNDLIAKMVFESSINTGLGLPIRYALDMFPHKTYFLLSLLHSLSKTNSCKSIFETVSILNTITTYCEQLDGNFVPIDTETVMLIEDRSVLPEDKIVIAKNTKGTIFNLDGRRMVKWNNIVLNGWRLLFYRLKYLTNQIKQGQMSSVMLNDEIVLQEISTVAFICSQLIAHNAYHPISHFKQIVNLLLDTFKLMVNFNQSSIRLFMAGIIQLCASIMKESFLPSEQIWFLLTEKKFLPYMIGYSNQFEEILTGTDTNISTLGYILSTDEFIKGNYELTISFMEIILYCVKRDEFLRENSIIASFIFVIKDIFPSYRLWNYRNEKDANQIGSMCIEIFYNLLNRARKRSSSKLEQIEKICTILLMEGNSAEYLLQIVRNGEETVKEKIMNSGNDALLVKDDQIITVRTSLLILSYLLELYAYVGVSEQKSKSVIEDLLFSSLNNSNPNMLLIFTYFIYQKYDIYLATNAMQLLSQLAYKFPMSMLACFGSNTESIRDHFLFRLETVTEDINFKISLLNFLSICVEHQPGLVEMFLNVSNDKGGVLNSVLEILEEKLEGQYLCPFELHQATLQFVAKFWLRPNIIAINLLKKNDKFWKLVSFPLFIGDKEQFHNSLCSYILKILSRELFYLKMLEKSDVVNQNLDQIFARMKKELIIDKLSKHIQEKIILPLNIDDDAVYLIDAWKDFLSSWTMFKQSESINLNVINDLLKNLSKLLNENEDGKYSKIVNKMSNLLLFLSSSWNSETIDLLKKGDFIENIIELFGNVIQNKEIISFNALISLNTCLLKTLVQMDELNQEPLFQHVCHMLNNSIQLISKQLNSRRDKINSDLNMEKKLVNVHLFIMITMMENVKKDCEKYIEILNKFEISELIFNLIIYLIHNNIHLDLGQNLPLYFITVSRWSQGADLLHNQNIINNIAVYFRLPNQLFQSKEINIDHDHVCNILSLLIRTVINMTIHLRHHFVESCISFIAVYSDSFCELCQAFRRNKQLKLANNVLLVIQLCSILSKYVKIWHSSHPISLKLMIEEVLFTSNSVIAFLLRPTLLRQTQQDLSMAQASTSNINNQLRLPSNGKELTIQANNLLLQILLYSFKFISDISPNLFELLEENSFNGIHQLHLSTNFSIPNVDSLEVLTFGSLVNFINFSIKSIYKFEKDSITSADKRRDMNLELSLLEFAMTILLNQSLIAKNTRTINEVDKQIFLREITNEMNTIITNLSTKPQRRQNSISMTITPIASRHSLTSTLYLMEKPYIQLMVKLMDNVIQSQ